MFEDKRPLRSFTPTAAATPQSTQAAATASDQWMDQYNANLQFTVQAFHHLHAALDAKFTR